MRVPDQVRKCVLFIGVHEPDLPAEPEPLWGGTGFIVAVPGGPGYHAVEKEGPRTLTTWHTSAVMVTARHVAKKLEGKEFFLRANKTDGTSKIIEGHADARWWYHPTEEKYVDAAVIVFPYGALPDLDIMPIPLPLFADDEKIEECHIGTGDEVFVTGLFTKVVETGKNQPIVRIGTVAMMPGEKIPFKDGFLIDAHLIELPSIGGLSGSPVFVRETLSTPLMDEPGSPHWKPGRRMHGVGPIMFFGSVIGHWEVPSGFNISTAEAINMGISPVVPAKKIAEIIMQPELVEFMNKEGQKKTAKAQSGATFDSAFTKKDFESALKKASRKTGKGKKNG